MQVKRVVRTGVIVLVVLACLGSAGLGAMLLHIHASVGRYCSMAQAAHPHPGDDVASLIDFMKSDTHSLRKRNLAAWTLGRLGDSAALPALESFYTGEECDHETQLCQGELYKAITLCGGAPHTRHERRPDTVEQE